MRQFSRMAVLATVVGALAFAAPAGAQSVTFSTMGLFTAGNCLVLNTNVCTVGSSTITFGVGGGTVFAPTNISYGDFISMSTGTSVFAGVNFRLTVNQTGPSAGSQIINGTMNGTMSNDASTVNWFPAPTAFSIGDADYLLQTPVPVVAPTTNGGLSSINGFVTVRPPTTTVPEPSTYVLMFAGLAAMGLVARRRVA